MRSLFHRHYTTSINTSDPNSLVLEIIDLCKSGFLSQSLKLLRSLNPLKIAKKPIIYASLLQACAKNLSLRQGNALHSHIIKLGIDSDRYISNSLLALHFKCSEISETRRVFDFLALKDVVTWTSMISSYVRANEPKRAFELYSEMEEQGVEPNEYTLSSLIKACGEMGNLERGKLFHEMVSEKGFESNCVITSALIDMYGKCSSFEEARKVFDEREQRDTICWTSLMASYTQNNQFKEALELFMLMQRSPNVKPDGFTFGTAIAACGNLGLIKQGKQIHSKFIIIGYEMNVVILSSIIDMYGKCGFMDFAHKVFDDMNFRNSVTWCALLNGYCQNGYGEEALALFRRMQNEGMGGDSYGLGTVLRACSSLSALRQGKEVHARFLRIEGCDNVVVESALIDMYSECGCIREAKLIFDETKHKNIVVWNAMICGFAQNGKGKEALGLFDEMINSGISPDYVTFIGALFGCGHSGLLEEGRHLFHSMTEKHGIDHGLEHCACMVDLLGRAGLLEEAEDLIERSNFKDDASLWAVLLGACTSYSNLRISERVAKRMIELDPKYHLTYVLLSNVYAAFGRWGEVSVVRNWMKERGIKKMPGRSWIEVKNKVHSFLAYDDSHPLKDAIYTEIRRLDVEMREVGYVPNMTHVIHSEEWCWKKG
ncbi:hypothetical protein AMTRI_Chr02g261750 [Amborella trichopoda]